MARLGSGKIHTIINKILRDLYSAGEAELLIRKGDIAKRNRVCVMAPLLQWINKLPLNLFRKNITYQLHINYETKTNIPEEEVKILNEIWEYTSKSENPLDSINPEHFGLYRSDPREGNLAPELQAVTKDLCEDILKLKTEKEELERYLRTTTNNYSGTIQLRKIWPASLHKYLPAEPLKQDRPRKLSSKTTVKTDKGVVVTPPTFIKQRLATNLLEKK